MANETSSKQQKKDDDRFLREHEEGLSRSTRQAKWIHGVDEHEDRPGQTLATRSHEVIQRWAEERDATPATIAGTEHDDRPGVLRFDFHGQGDRTGEGEDDRLQEIDWDAWFQPFDERELVFLFQEHLASGEQSNFFRLDNPRREDA